MVKGLTWSSLVPKTRYRWTTKKLILVPFYANLLSYEEKRSQLQQQKTEMCFKDGEIYILIKETYAGLQLKPTHLCTEWLTFHVPRPKMGNSIPLLNLTTGVFSSLNAMTAAAKRLILWPNLKLFNVHNLTETFSSMPRLFQCAVRDVAVTRFQSTLLAFLLRKTVVGEPTHIRYESVTERINSNTMIIFFNPW